MSVGLLIENSIDVSFGVVNIKGYKNGIEINNSTQVNFPIVNSRHPNIEDHQKEFYIKGNRNVPCLCGSGIKSKKCKGVSPMSTGIKSDNSAFTVGTANIVADTGVDLKNNSKAHFDELNYFAPNTPIALVNALRSLPTQPPHELVEDAIEYQKANGNIDGSRLRDWFDKQGINLSFWAQLSVAIAGLS
ncbi:SEC-C metal-binding domain-containing protein [Pseudomonas sp. 25 E 4]|uniref:SEC-C metal-binding domain-containing protein n=1 Tax=Pseudomonas sp. 25 E 4 TaxID=1844097 RepID=UPI000812AF7B|nr:SEC-C metal-binding domain-containing protein [Pseudomonas sp. 25 E 4]CRM71117.1 hypothetical protein [Pseudomonas sp. 25 E 4]